MCNARISEVLRNKATTTILCARTGIERAYLGKYSVFGTPSHKYDQMEEASEMGQSESSNFIKGTKFHYDEQSYA